MEVGEILINWYSKNKRDLPWRETKDPYKIWISEIILQQTRVDQGLSYYHRFIEKFTDVASLAKADEDVVLKIWQGLGYYSRARNLHFSAKYIYRELSNVFPDSYNKLIKLKGVGEYTAAAIASFAYNEKVALVDGNVYRFLSRLFAVSTPIDTTEGKKMFKNIAFELLDGYNAEDFNQAIMEFGALQCKPSNPDCVRCDLNNKCEAFKKKEVDDFPFKTKKIKVKKRYLNYFFVIVDESVLLRKRDKKDIWLGLYEPILIETRSKYSIGKLFNTNEWKNLFNDRKIIITGDSSATHKLTHQHLIIKFYKIKIDDELSDFVPEGYIKVPLEKIDEFAVPKIIELQLNTLFNKT